jgi:hypothetical protein
VPIGRADRVRLLAGRVREEPSAVFRDAAVQTLDFEAVERLTVPRPATHRTLAPTRVAERDVVQQTVLAHLRDETNPATRDLFDDGKTRLSKLFDLRRRQGRFEYRVDAREHCGVATDALLGVLARRDVADVHRDPVEGRVCMDLDPGVRHLSIGLEDHRDAFLHRPSVVGPTRDVGELFVHPLADQVID